LLFSIPDVQTVPEKKGLRRVVNKKLGLALKIAIGLLVLWAVIRSIDVGDSFKLVKEANLIYLLLCGGLLNIDRFFMAFKWGLLLNQKKQKNIPFFPLVKSYYLSSIVSSIVPPTVGEDIVRGVSVARAGVDTKSVLSSIVAERVFGTLSMILLVVVTLFFLILRYPQIDRALLYGSIALAVIVIIVVVVSLYFPVGRYLQSLPFSKGEGKVISLIKKSYTAFRAYRHRKKRILIFIILSILENCFVVVGLFLIALSINVDVKWSDMLLTVPTITLFSKIPITFGGIGIQEGIFVALLSLIGVPATHAFTISVLGRVVNIVAVLPVFISFYLWGLTRPKATTKPSMGK
jgi:uncharacterized protein (TIRG00374 family)